MAEEGASRTHRLLDRQPVPLQQFVLAMSPADAQTAIAADPGLVAGRYDANLQELLDCARATAEDMEERALLQRMEILRQLREGRIDPTTRGEQADPNATRLGNEALQSVDQAERRPRRKTARAALRATRRLLGDSSFRLIPQPTQAYAWNAAARAHILCYREVTVSST